MTPSSSIIRAATRDNSRLNILSFCSKMSHENHVVYNIKSDEDIPVHIDFDLAICDQSVKDKVFKLTSFYHIPLIIIKNDDLSDIDKKINECVTKQNLFEIVY